MYTLLLLSGRSFAFPSDFLWCVAFANLLAAVLAIKRPSALSYLAALAAADILIGLAFVGYALRPGRIPRFALRADVAMTRAAFGAAGAILAVWVYSGNRGYEVLLPVRGRWAARFAALAALLMVQMSSMSNYVPVNLMRAFENTLYKVPDLTPAAIAAAITLPGYYLALWNVLVAGRKVAAVESADTSP